MKLFAGLEAIVKTEEPLAPRTWYKLGGPAQYFIEPRTVEELSEVLRRCAQNEVPVRVLGGGANLLVDDSGVRGAVVHLAGAEFTRVAVAGEALRAGGGAAINALVLQSARAGLSGAECLTGVPGTVGGAVRMNAGGAFGDIGSVIESVDLMDADGVAFTRHRGELVFAYRESNVKSKVILGAELRLVEDDPQRVLNQIKQIWIHKKNTQPLGTRNAGSVFKNPPDQAAGALIDRCGLKGTRVGGACVSEKHANFIVAENGARASDVLKLINLVREAVYKRWKVYLELEIEVW